MAADLLIHASTLASATMRHEVPGRVLDPFLYGEHDGRRFAVVSVLDAPNLPDGVEILDPFSLGLMDLVSSGLDRESALAQVCVRAVASVGLTAALVPREFPLFVAEALRAAGVALTVDGAFFDARRRALSAGSPIIVDLWPQDRASGCWSDMTRTFVVGEPTQRSSEGWPSPLRDGVFSSLGHGVGLETHEAPGLGPSGREPLVAGDVLAVEPGTGRHGVGAARVEDLYLVGEDGVELLTPFPHELDPRVGAGA